MAYTLREQLKKTKEFLEKCLIAEEITLYQSVPDGQHGKEKPKLVTPKVAIGNLPHQNFNLYGAPDQFFQAPYVLIGLDDADVSLTEKNINIVIQACLISQDVYQLDETAEDYNLMLPDNLGYSDCLGFLEWIMKKFIDADVIDGNTVEYPMRIGMYATKELTYPYSFGYISFSLLGAEKKIDFNKLEEE